MMMVSNHRTAHLRHALTRSASTKKWVTLTRDQEDNYRETRLKNVIVTMRESEEAQRGSISCALISLYLRRELHSL